MKSSARPEKPNNPDSSPSNRHTIRVFLLSPYELCLAGLRSAITPESDMTVVGQARNLTEALDSAGPESSDVILVDLDFGDPGNKSLKQLSDLINAAPKTRVVVMTASTDSKPQLEAIHIGAMGVVLKTESAQTLLKAIRKVYVGETWINRSLVTAVLSNLRSRKLEVQDPEAEKIASLTARELEIIAAVSQGMRNKRIGELLCISDKTVCHYLTSVFQKLEVKDRMELMLYANKHSLDNRSKPFSSGLRHSVRRAGQ